MVEDRFPYEQSAFCPGDLETARRWNEVLESTGTESVRARLVQSTFGSRASMAIGTETNMTKGFVEQWLGWHDQNRSKRELSFRRNQIFWTRWAALAASVAAAAGAIGWIVTIWRKG